jgi:hypothetical protein
LAYIIKGGFKIYAKVRDTPINDPLTGIGLKLLINQEYLNLKTALKPIETDKMYTVIVRDSEESRTKY